MRAPHAGYDAIPVGPELIELIKVLIRAKVSFLLEGESGCGKSEILEQAAAELDIEARVLNIANLEPGDLLGLPTIVQDRTVYALPFWCPVEGEGFIVLAELNRADAIVKNPMLEFLSSGRLHVDYSLPKGWSICAAINPETEDYDVSRLDRALRKRFITLRVRADRKTWLDWAHRADVHPAILALAHTHERIFETVCPRTWTNVSKLLHAMPSERLRDKRFLRLLLTGELGPGWVSTLSAELSRTASGLGLSEYEVLRNFEASGAEIALPRFRKDGDTDCIDELTTRLEEIVAGPELAELEARGEFCLESFEAVIRALLGDHRERLQEAFARNHEISANLLDLKPEQLIEDYQKRSVHRRYRHWLREDHLRHRAWSLAYAVPERLERRGDVQELKSHAAVLRNLAKIATDLEGRAEPLLHGLNRLGITPLFSSSGTAA